MNAADYYAQKLQMPSGAHGGLLDNPIRKHDADGIVTPELARLSAQITPENRHCEVGLPNTGTVLPKLSEAANLALELIDDLCSPEAYGHAVPAEVVKRAGRIRAMLRPAPSCGVGYSEPPPARCEFCDSE